MSDLKSCPFCGNDAKVRTAYISDSTKTLWAVECSNLDCTCGLYDFKTKEEAIKTWNDRVGETLQR